MNELRSTSRGRRIVGVLILGGAVLAGTYATAAAFSGNGSNDGETPAAPAPTQAPIVTPAPTATPSPEPTDGGGDAIPIRVDLETADGHDVYVDIDDLSGTLESATSGVPGDGMSVEPYTLHVGNLDERTLKLTWVDFGIDNALALHITEDAAVFVMIQPEPSETVDAMGFDRELILTFEGPISAEDIEPFLQGGWDTPGDA